MSTQQSPLSGKTIILGVSASIAAYKAADLCSRTVPYTQAEALLDSVNHRGR